VADVIVWQQGAQSADGRRLYLHVGLFVQADC